MRRRARVALLVATSCALAHPLVAQPSQHRSFSFYSENDAYDLLGKGSSDSSYTNGVRIAWDILHFSERLGRWQRRLSLDWLADAVNGHDAVPAARKACAPREDRTDGRLCGSLGFGLTQTMYTPSDIVVPSLQRRDRPYAGLLLGSVYLTTLRRRVHSTTELQVGMLGPWSGSESTQSLAHWTWSPGSAKPRGWHNQLRNAAQIGLVNSYAFRPKYSELCLAKFGCNGGYGEARVFDVTPRVEGVLGTHMIRGSAGGIARLGWRFPDVVGLSRIPVTAARASDGGSFDPWFNFFLSYDRRAVLHNAMITGRSLYRSDRWDDVRQISLTRDVAEIAYGVSAGFARASLVAQVVRRSGEYGPSGGWHRFGTLTLMLHTPPFFPD